MADPGGLSPGDGAAPERIKAVSWARIESYQAWKIEDRSGRSFVFKRNTGGRYALFLDEAERRRRDISNILASRLLVDLFALPAVLYRDAVVEFPDGRRSPGIVSAYIEGLRALEDVAAGEVVNGAEALEQAIVVAWMGDIDRIRSPANGRVTPEGRYVVLDFDFCFQDGVSLFGVPFVDRTLLARFGGTEAIEKAILRVVQLSDAEIGRHVSQLGDRWISDWSPALQASFVQVLIRNRRRLAQARGLFSVARHPLARARTRFVVDNVRKLSAATKLRRIISRQGARGTAAALVRNIAGRG